MAPIATAFDTVHFYMNEFTSKVVAKSGIPSDRFHFGKLILEGLKEHPDFVLQIDGATEEIEPSKSVLERTIKCAVSLQKLGLKEGDVVVIIAPNHIDLCIPMYAALSLGITVAPMDCTLEILEIKAHVLNMEPKIIFCQNNKTATITRAMKNTGLDSIIITFDKGGDFIEFYDFINTYENDAIKEFKPANFNPETTLAFLLTTSGTTGNPKLVSLSHKNLSISMPYVWARFTTFPTPTKLSLVVSSAHWLSAIIHYLCAPILRYTRIQSSHPATEDLVIHLINKFKPTYAILNPPLMARLLKKGNFEKCDFSCLDHILLAGSYVSPVWLDDIKKVLPTVQFGVAYGQSEISGFAVQEGTNAHGLTGRIIGAFDCRLVDIETLEDIEATHVNGELWLRGPSVFLGYYRNPEETNKIFVNDWIRTGDIFYKDEAGHLYYVERMKLFIKYNNYHVSPTQVETVIREHPAVMDVAVTGIDDQDHGELVVACVVPKPGCKVLTQELKDLVKENLSDANQLRGGVIFMDELPMTSTAKINRKKLKEIVLTVPRE